MKGRVCELRLGQRGGSSYGNNSSSYAHSKCGMCVALLGNVSIGCGCFNSRYHPNHVCTGLPDSVINAIKEYGGRGINFSYTSCRFEGGSVGLMSHNLAVLLMTLIKKVCRKFLA